MEFYAAAAHLLPSSEEAWRQFIAEVHQYEPPGTYYSYQQLEALLDR